MYIWNLFKEMDSLQSQLGNLADLHNFSDFSFSPKRSTTRFPLINVSNNENAIIVESLAPGIDMKTLKVSALQDKLTISGKRIETEKIEGKYHRCERANGEFSRSIELPFPINPDEVSAKYKNGILTITLPKVEEVKPKLIDITLN